MRQQQTCGPIQGAKNPPTVQYILYAVKSGKLLAKNPPTAPPPPTQEACGGVIAFTRVLYVPQLISRHRFGKDVKAHYFSKITAENYDKNTMFCGNEK